MQASRGSGTARLVCRGSAGFCGETVQRAPVARCASADFALRDLFARGGKIAAFLVERRWGGGVIFRLTKMKIRRLKIENFRGIVDETIDFDPSFTVFAGRNGGGKSTILEAIA